MSSSPIPLALPKPLCNNKYIMAQELPITDLLRKTINASGIPFLTLEQKTGVLRQSLMKFARGESSLNLSSADEVARFFGLELRPAAKARQRTKPAKEQAGQQKDVE